MDVKLIISKCCFFIKRKTGCLLMANCVYQSIAMVQAFYLWITNESVLKILEEDKIDFWKFISFILSIGLALVLTIATISFIVVLIARLHKDETRLIKFYFIFSSIMLTVTFLFCINLQSK